MLLQVRGREVRARALHPRIDVVNGKARATGDTAVNQRNNLRQKMQPMGNYRPKRAGTSFLVEYGVPIFGQQ